MSIFVTINSGNISLRGMSIASSELYDLMSAVRGPDSNDAGIRATMTVKSVTSVVVRRALFGVVMAADHSNPEEPEFDLFATLSNEDVAQISQHFLVHQYKALCILRDHNLADPADMPHLSDVIHRLGLIANI